MFYALQFSFKVGFYIHYQYIYIGEIMTVVVWIRLWQSIRFWVGHEMILNSEHCLHFVFLQITNVTELFCLTTQKFVQLFVNFHSQASCIRKAGISKFSHLFIFCLVFTFLLTETWHLAWGYWLTLIPSMISYKVVRRFHMAVKQLIF